MSEERPKYKTGLTIDEYIQLHLNELDDDDIGVPLGAIVASARRQFGLEGAALIDFVRRAVALLVNAGARPRHEGMCSPWHREGELHWGTDTPAEIVDGIVGTWVAEGMPELQWGDFRLNYPANWIG